MHVLPYSALEKQDSRRVTAPADDKVPAPDYDTCSLVLRAAAGQGLHESLPFVA